MGSCELRLLVFCSVSPGSAALFVTGIDSFSGIIESLGGFGGGKDSRPSGGGYGLL